MHLGQPKEARAPQGALCKLQRQGYRNCLPETGMADPGRSTDLMLPHFLRPWSSLLGYDELHHAPRMPGMTLGKTKCVNPDRARIQRTFPIPCIRAECCSLSAKTSNWPLD